MSRQHYLPACYVGRFSAQSTERARRRPVWFQMRNQSGTKQVLAENIALEKDIYTLAGVIGTSLKGKVVDETWARYERRLSSSLDRLVTDSPLIVSADEWLRVLVPFVAAMFVRTPAFERRYSSLFQSLVADGQWTAAELKDNTNISRWPAMNRLLAPVMSATWTVLHLPRYASVLNNDRGLANIRSRDATVATLIPIDSHHVLRLIFPGVDEGRKIVYDAGKADWFAIIDHSYVTMKDTAPLNYAIAGAAESCIFGPNREIVECHARAWDRYELLLPEISPRMQIVHELDWHRVVSAVTRSFDDPNVGDFEIDFDSVLARHDEALFMRWRPLSMAFPVNLPVFVGGLTARGRSIELHMSSVPGYTDYSPEPFPWENHATKGTTR